MGRSRALWSCLPKLLALPPVAGWPGRRQPPPRNGSCWGVVAQPAGESRSRRCRSAMEEEDDEGAQPQPEGWFMKYQHVNPEEAVRIHIDVQTKKSVAIHWGTFALANEYYLDPPVKLNEALERYGLKPEDFFILQHGESRDLNTNEDGLE